MKSALFVLALAFAPSAFAQPVNVLLDCNLAFGPNQAVRVLETEQGLILEELTNTGMILRRPLKRQEMNLKRLNLRIDSAIDSGVMTLEVDGRWSYDIGGAIGYASCR